MLSSVVLGLVFVTTATLIDHQTVTAINTEMAGLQDIHQRGGPGALVKALERRVAGYQGYHHVYLLATRDGEPMVGNLHHWPRVEPDSTGWLRFTVEDDTDQRRDLWPVQARVVPLASGLRLMVGRDMTERSNFAQIMEQSLAFALAAALILGILGGVVMSRNLLRRLDAVNRTAATILAGDLSGRVPVSGAGDEFDRLAANLNTMLDRIQKLIMAMRSVTDNVAHDLRSPLNRLRSRLEITLVGKPDMDEYQASLQGALEDIDTILQTFNALLSIARIEGRNATETFEPLDIAEIAEGTVELYEPVADERDQHLTFDGPGAAVAALVNGDRHLLMQTAANLVDNAIKYAPQGARIAVRVSVTDGTARLEVADDGPGIPEEHRHTVLDRFVRLEQSRHTSGTGLGLSLVAAVAELHGAVLALEDNDPGLRVVMTFVRHPQVRANA
ncbi:sensor histidine kinase [Roseospira visakhapatnamensis]|uniref:histidine kinase n=1 Tax=Roseospira visakhapatnamensis TaxID=390880 RepID=A0A7W6W9G4_9PROT|nr:HAMP domain-containing sensor histidine kinase [Roseospira visakhapatnamensis]MBB4265427.1 signal transduction histidine kinase [Roseospira visakhapatnamensis]